MGASFGDVCNGTLPQTSKWYRIFQVATASLETLAILLFIYIHRKSKYLHQTISSSPLNNGLLSEDDESYDDNIEEEILIHHTNNNITCTQPKTIANSIGYKSPKIQNLNVVDMTSDESPISNLFDIDSGRRKLNNFSLDDNDESNEEDCEYYNESQNRYWKMNIDGNSKKRSTKTSLSSLSSSLTASSSSSATYRKNKPKHRETLTMIEANTDNYRIFFILVPIYYQFLALLCVYCVYRMIYMTLLCVNIGSDFGEYSNPVNGYGTGYIQPSGVDQRQIINLIGLSLFEYIESTINHIVTFWFLQPSSGVKALRISFVPASIIGCVDSICTIFAIIHVKYRNIYLIFHLIMLTFYVLIFFYMILNQKLRWRLFYFYIIFFIVLYVLYSLGDAFVMITDGQLDGCMDELAQIMFSICIPIILALLLFDDSSYWLQLSTELIGDKKDFIIDLEQTNSNKTARTQQSGHGDLFVNSKALKQILVNKNNRQQQLQMDDDENDEECSTTISVTKLLWGPKLAQSVGRFDNKANFDRVIDQLSMTIPVIKRSEIEIIGDNNTSLIGFGSYSAVKKAKILKTGELVAIKSLYSFDDENYKYVVEFMREAFLSQRLKHSNIVDFKGVLADRPHLCLVYEYMTNGSVFEYLTKDRIKYRLNFSKYYKSISLSKRIKFAIDAAKGIQCLHSHNIIHRDINCRNLLITTTNNYINNESNPNINIIVKVCDFGTARQISKYITPSLTYTTFTDEKDKEKEDGNIINDEEDEDVSHNMNDSAIASTYNMLNKQMTTGIGTVAYMAPEILKYVDFTKKLKRENIRDKIEYDFAVDAFSFGGVLFELMASKELFEDLQTSKEVQQFVLSGKREKIPQNVVKLLNIPSCYSQLMNQCWTHYSSQRPHFKDIIVRLQNIARKARQQKRRKQAL